MKILWKHVTVMLAGAMLSGCVLGAEPDVIRDEPKTVDIAECKGGVYESLNGLCWGTWEFIDAELPPEAAMILCEELDVDDEGWRLPTATEFDKLLGACLSEKDDDEKKVSACRRCLDATACNEVFDSLVDLDDRYGDRTYFMTSQEIPVDLVMGTIMSGYDSYDFTYYYAICVRDESPSEVRNVETGLPVENE